MELKQVSDWKDPQGFEAWVKIRGKLGLFKSKAFMKRLANSEIGLSLAEQETLLHEMTGAPRMKWGGGSVEQDYNGCLRLAGLR